MFCLQVEVNIDDEAKLTQQGVAAFCHLNSMFHPGIPHPLQIGVLMSGFQYRFLEEVCLLFLCH